MKAQIKKAGEYDAPPELKRQLRELEDAVKRAVDDTHNAKGAKLDVTPVRRSDYDAKLDELVLCEAPAAGMIVNLPDAGRNDIGREIVVKNVTTSTNTITVRPPGAVRVNLTTAWSIATSLASNRFIWSGDAWWTV